MRPSAPHSTLVTVLLAAILLVLFTDILAVSAAADPLPTNTTGAVLAPISPSNISRPYTHNSLTLSSRLDGTGQPIPDARVDILQQVTGSNQTQLVGSTVTRADGSLTATIPAGPSRLIDLAYRAPEGGPYLAQTEVIERVTAGLRLRVTPQHTIPTGTVQLEGHVLGVLPTHGVVVEVLVYYLGQWQPIRTPRTTHDGRVQLTYRFHQATGQFPFRLRVRYGQAGFPYGEACSRWVEVLA
jgi:5-hydroxyisourate hydrolase-like protein (transthyretin family)